MVDFIETKIFEGLIAHLGTLVLDPVLPVAMPNVSFDTPDSGAYLKVNHLPAETTQATNNSNRHRGLFQVSVFWPEDEGETKPNEIAGAIIEHFKIKTVINFEGAVIRILRPPFKLPAGEEPGWIQIPVRIPYVTDAIIQELEA